MIERLPSLIAGCCLLVYWGAVVSKAVRFARKEKHDANVIPRETTGRWLRVVWIPAIVAWCFQPWRRVFGPAQFQPLYLSVFGLVGATVCVIATAATFVCWREMGKSWRIGIDPGETTTLIFTGPYRFVRHPIYALGSLLAIGTLATTPTRLMLLLAFLHLGFLQIEARREERYLLGKHGSAYADYTKRVSRFLPRASSRG